MKLPRLFTLLDSLFTRRVVFWQNVVPLTRNSRLLEVWTLDRLGRLDVTATSYVTLRTAYFALCLLVLSYFAIESCKLQVLLLEDFKAHFLQELRLSHRFIRPSLHIPLIALLLLTQRIQEILAHLLYLLPEEHLDSLIFSNLLWRLGLLEQIVRRNGHLLVLIEETICWLVAVNHCGQGVLGAVFAGLGLLIAYTLVVFGGED